MNASIKSRVAVATLGLLATVGLLAGSASAEPSDAPSDQGTVVVGTAGNTRYVATDGEVIWGNATPAMRRCQGSSLVEYDVFPDNLDATLLSAQAAIAARENCAEVSA